MGLSPKSNAASLLSSDLRMTRLVGTPLYMAPEVLCEQSYSYSADVYSFGIVLCEIATRLWPWEEDTSITDTQRLREAVLAGRRPSIPDSCPRAFAELIQACWRGDPALRPTFPQILAHTALDETVSI
jgi:serine/threonine protein kinase